MKMDTKKIMAIFAILMMTLGIAGFAYAHWTETLVLNGTVKTGKFCLDWSFSAVLPPSNLKDLDGDNQIDDPVATLGYQFEDQNGDGCNDYLNISLFNAYPCLWVNGTIDIHNCGTIPAGIYALSYTITDPNGVQGGIELYSVDFYLVDPQGVKHPITEDIEDWIKYENQIDPGWSLLCEFKIHFTESTPEDATANILATIEFWNWNEITRP